MDLLKDAAKNLNLYEVKSYVRKAQNVAMNLTEMETKVREATNNEPWGAPTTLMAQIASGTYNYREREEIISFIFRRFTEKAANEWRQIYKSLQLLEYLIKNGSERLIDDVRSNLSLIQMLKYFHYIDSKGRDQGINVRNRSKNLIELLNDDSLIRSERKKARANAKKFGSLSSAAYGGASSIQPGSAYADDDYTGRVFGDGGVYGARYDDTASAYSNGQSGNSNENFEEYNVAPSNGASKPTTKQSKVTAKPTEFEGDLLGGDFTTEGSSSQAAQADDDDEFDDFQAAETPQTQKPSLSNNLASLYQSQPQFSQQLLFTTPQFTPQYQTPQLSTPGGNRSSSFSHNQSFTALSVKSEPKNDAFSSLFSSAKTKVSSSPKTEQSKPAAPAPSSTKPDDEDFFGGFTSNNQPSHPASNHPPKDNDGEVDLLSF